MTNTSSSTSSSSSSFEDQSIDPSMVTPSPEANFESSDSQDDTIPVVPNPRTLTRRPLARNLALQRSVSTADPLAVNVTSTNDAIVQPFVPKPREHKIVDIDDFMSIADHDCKFCTYHEWTFNFQPQRYINDTTGFNDVSKADHIHWLTISDSKTVINGYFGNCKIQVTAKSDVEFNSCEIYSPGFDVVESPIEIFASSKATFSHCKFHDVPFGYQNSRPMKEDGTPRHSVGVVVRDRSEVTFIDCTFDVDDVGVLILDHAAATFIDCTFNQHSPLTATFNRFCIYAYRGSTINVKRCRFHEFNGKHVFALDFSTINVNDMTSNRSVNAVIAANESVANIEHLVVFDTKHAGVRASKNSKLYIYDCFIEDSEGNGIQMEQSTGIVVDAHINNTKFPSIFISGANANPIFEHCIIENSQSFAIGVRHCARPVFNHMLIRNCASYSVKANSFCNFEMYNVRFETVSKPIVMLAGKSHLYFEHCDVIDPTVEYCHIPLHLCDISEDSMTMNHAYDIDIFTMVRLCTIVDRRTFTPTTNVTHTVRNGIHVLSWRQPPTVKSVTDVSETTLFNRVGVSHLLTFDVEKISTFKFKDQTFANPPIDRNVDPKIPDLLRHRTIDQTKRLYKRKKDTKYTCIFCEKQVNIATDRVKVVLPCGHLCCEDCFNNTDDHFDGKCPRCQTTMTNVRDLYFVDQYCCTCLDAKPTTIMLPCCHVCTCYACATACMDRNKCPICNSSTTGFIALE